MIRLALSKIAVCLIRTYMCHAGKVLSYTKLSLTFNPLNAEDAIVAHNLQLQIKENRFKRSEDERR